MFNDLVIRNNCYSSIFSFKIHSQSSVFTVPYWRSPSFSNKAVSVAEIMLVNPVPLVCTRERLWLHVTIPLAPAFIYKAPPCFLPPFCGFYWRSVPLQLWPHAEVGLWNDVSKTTHISHSFKYNLYYLVLIKECGFMYLWKLAQLRNSTPLQRGAGTS